MKRTLKDIEELEGELGESIGFHRTGTLRVGVSKANKTRLQKDAELSEQAGVVSHWVDLDEASSLVPFLSLPPSATALFTPDDGYIDPSILASSYLFSAKKSGRLKTMFNTSVKTLELAPDETVSAVITSCGKRVESSYVIDCCGSWAGLLGYNSAAQFQPLSMSPTRSHYWKATSPETSSFPLKHPNIILPDCGVYTRASPSGIILGVQELNSTTRDARSLEITPESHTSLDALEHEAEELLGSRYEEISSFIPALGSLELNNYVSGFSSYTLDGKYIIGRQRQGTNLYVVSGCNGSGVAASGGIGELLAKVSGSGLGSKELIMHILDTSMGIADISYCNVFAIKLPSNRTHFAHHRAWRTTTSQNSRLRASNQWVMKSSLRNSGTGVLELERRR